MNVAVLCKPENFDKAKALISNRAWKSFHIKTHHESWLEMKENNFKVFVFYFDDWQEKYEGFMLLLKESFPASVFILLAEAVPPELAKKLLKLDSFGVFDPVRDKNTIVEGMEKLLAGQAVHYRKEERFRAYPFVSVLPAGQKDWLTYRITNLSFSGAEIQGKSQHMRQGDSVKIKFESGEGKVRSFDAVVRWVMPNQSFGLEFIKQV